MLDSSRAQHYSTSWRKRAFEIPIPQLDLVSDISRDVVIVDAGRVIMEGDVRDLRERADFRYASVGFAEETAWEPIYSPIPAADAYA